MRESSKRILSWIIILSFFLSGQPMLVPYLYAAEDDQQPPQMITLPSLDQNLTDEGAEALQESMREGVIEQTPSSPFPGPVDPNTYLVGVGDQFILHFWGKKNESIPVVVSPEGFLFIPNIGTVQVADKKLSQVKTEVADKVRRIYRDISFELFLQTPRRFQVQVVGLVKKPGVYVASPVTRVDEIIRNSEGFEKLGSERRIEIHRRSGEILFADLVRWRRTGESSTNPFLHDGDTVLVPKIKRLIFLHGTTVKRGAYEVLDGEDLYDMIFFLGMGLTSETSLRDESYIIRIGDDERRKIIPFDLKKLTQQREYAREFDLNDGDVVRIPSISMIQNVVVVRGAIFGTGQLSLENRRRTEPDGRFYETSGVYELREGETVYDLLQKTGGVTPWADLQNCSIERQTGDNTEPQLIKVNLARILIERNFDENIVMKPGDILNIPSKIDRVFVTGEVAQRGPQEYLANHTAQEYLGRAGGQTSRGAIGRAKIICRDGTAQDYDPLKIIQPGDTIYVPETHMKWWQDYWTIIIGAATLALTGITAYNSSR